MGTQGGGQQSRAAPVGGGGGKAIHNEVVQIIKTNVNIFFEFIVIYIIDRKYIKKNIVNSFLLKNHT